MEVFFTLIYLKCDNADCKGTATIAQGLLHTMNDQGISAT